MKRNVRRLTESAMLLSLALVLEVVSKMFIPPLAFGGQVTLVSMLPVVLISYRHGVRWGTVCGFGFALMEMALGGGTLSAAFQPGYFGDGALVGRALLMVLLDYVLAFTLLGLGGCFRRVIRRPGVGLMLGSIAALTARYCAHVLSGFILFGGWAEWFFTQDGFPAWGAELVAVLSPNTLALVYSLVYNGMYMIPEIILTALVSLFIARGPQVAQKIS